MREPANDIRFLDFLFPGPWLRRCAAGENPLLRPVAVRSRFRRILSLALPFLALILAAFYCLFESYPGSSMGDLGAIFGHRFNLLLIFGVIRMRVALGGSSALFKRMGRENLEELSLTPLKARAYFAEPCLSGGGAVKMAAAVALAAALVATVVGSYYGRIEPFLGALLIGDELWISAAFWFEVVLLSGPASRIKFAMDWERTIQGQQGWRLRSGSWVTSLWLAFTLRAFGIVPWTILMTGDHGRGALIYLLAILSFNALAWLIVRDAASKSEERLARALHKADRDYVILRRDPPTPLDFLLPWRWRLRRAMDQTGPYVLRLASREETKSLALAALVFAAVAVLANETVFRVTSPEAFARHWPSYGILNLARLAIPLAFLLHAFYAAVSLDSLRRPGAGPAFVSEFLHAAVWRVGAFAAVISVLQGFRLGEMLDYREAMQAARVWGGDGILHLGGIQFAKTVDGVDGSVLWPRVLEQFVILVLCWHVAVLAACNALARARRSGQRLMHGAIPTAAGVGAAAGLAFKLAVALQLALQWLIMRRVLAFRGLDWRLAYNRGTSTLQADWNLGATLIISTPALLLAAAAIRLAQARILRASPPPPQEGEDR